MVVTNFVQLHVWALFLKTVGYIGRCRFCDEVFSICIKCFRGHVYCSSTCSEAGRKKSKKQANENYAQTENGRKSQSIRNKRHYLKCRDINREKDILTDQSYDRSDEIVNLPIETSFNSKVKPKSLSTCCLCSIDIAVFFPFRDDLGDEQSVIKLPP